jgi:hypothetical protein
MPAGFHSLILTRGSDSEPPIDRALLQAGAPPVLGLRMHAASRGCFVAMAIPSKANTKPNS